MIETNFSKKKKVWVRSSKIAADLIWSAGLNMGPWLTLKGNLESVEPGVRPEYFQMWAHINKRKNVHISHWIDYVNILNIDYSDVDFVCEP